VCTLVEDTVDAGPGVAVWSGRDAGGRRMSSGIYYLRVAANGNERLLKVVLVD
jgi:hypothetical protein